MKKIVYILILVLSLAECARINSRQNLKRDRPRAVTRVSRSRGDVLENLFNIYDPSFLSVVWPKINNGVHLFIERECWTDVAVFFKDLSDGRAWAYNAVDASGRYRAGLFEGSRHWLGSGRQCRELDESFTRRDVNATEPGGEEPLGSVLRREKYLGDTQAWRALVRRDSLLRRLVAADRAPPARLAYSVLELTLNLTKVTMAESYDITLGVCLPRSCSLEDVASIINFNIMINDNLKTNKTLPRVVKIKSLRHVEGSYDIGSDIGAVILICVTVFLVALTATATLIDLKLVKCKARHSKSMSFDLQKFNNNLETTRNPDDESHNCDVLARKESNVVDMETLTINNINNSNNINLVTVKKVMKANAMPPSITLDVVSMERVTGSCMRCGKYKKQCDANYSNNTRHTDLPACPRVKSFASLTAEHKREHRFFKSLLLCFSLTYSWKRIFNTNTANKDLGILHGLRILATFWVIFVHVSMIANYSSDDGGDINDYNNAYYILMTGTIAFDTLFFVSGLFSSHHFFFLNSQYTVEELVSFGGPCGQALQFICFVTNRAIRLLPSYAFAVYLSAILSRVSLHTSALALPEGDHSNCDVYWWRNLLYITTAFPKDEQCMQISWYMSSETQLHVFGALACALAVSGRRVVSALATAAILVATAADVSGAYAEFEQYMPNVYAAYATVIERPLARIAPYFLGVFGGWLVHRMSGELNLYKSRAICLWVASLLAITSSLVVPWVTRGWVVSWLHVVWPAAWLWPALVFSTDLAAFSRRLLDSGAVAALSRLCYCCLLLHGPVARAMLLASDTAMCSQTLCVWSYFAGSSLVTVCAALALSLLVETPCCSLLRRLSDRVS